MAVLMALVLMFLPQIKFDAPRSTLPNIKKDFYGRDGDMNYLVNILDFFNDAVRFANIVGPPGIGKSTLAINVGHKMLAKGDVYYIDLADFNDQNFKQELAEKIVFDKAKDATFDSLIDWGRNKWWRRNRLIILDNCDDIILGQKDNYHDAIDKLLRYSDGNLKIMTTSRKSLLHFDNHIVYKLNPIDTESAYKILEFRNPSLLSKLEKQMIVDLTGRVPLALKIVGALLSNKMNSASEIIEQLKNQPIDALSPPDLRSSEQLNSSISLSYKHLDSNTQKVGHYLSIFSGSFDQHTAEGVLRHLVEKNDISKVHSSLNILVRFSLIEFDEQLHRFYFHKLIKDFFNTSNSVTNSLHFFHGMKLYYSQELCTMTREFKTSPQKALRKLDLHRHHIQLLISSKIEVQSNLDLNLADCVLKSLEMKFINGRFTPEEIISILQPFTSSFSRLLTSNLNMPKKSKVAVSNFTLYVYLTIELCDILREIGQSKDGLKVIETSIEIVEVFCEHYRAQEACKDIYSYILIHYEKEIDVERAKIYLIKYLDQSSGRQTQCITYSVRCKYLDIAKLYYVLKDYKKAEVFFEKSLYNDMVLYSIHERVPIMLELRKNLTAIASIKRIDNELKQYYNILMKLSPFDMSRLATTYIADYQKYLIEIGEPDKAYAIQDSWIQAMEEIGEIVDSKQLKVAASAVNSLTQAGEYNRSVSIIQMILYYIEKRSLPLDYGKLNLLKGVVMYYMNNFTESEKAFVSAIEHMITSNFTYDSYSPICSMLIFRFHNSDYLGVCLMGSLKSSARFYGSGFLYVLLKSPFDYVPVKSQNTSEEVKTPLSYFPSLPQHSHGADLVNEAGGVFPFKSVNKIAASMLEYILTIIHNNCIYLFESNTLRCFCNFISILVRLMILGDIIHLICLLFGVYYNIFQEAFNFLILVLLVKFKCSWCFY